MMFQFILHTHRQTESTDHITSSPELVDAKDVKHVLRAKTMGLMKIFYSTL